MVWTYRSRCWPGSRSGGNRLLYCSDRGGQCPQEAEILRERLNTLRDISDYTGKYFSHQWITANVLQMTEEQQQTMEDQIADETAEGGHAEDDAF